MRLFNIFKKKKEDKKIWMYLAYKYKKDIPLKPYIFRFFETKDELIIFDDKVSKRDIKKYPEFTEFIRGNNIFYKLEEKTK